MEAKIYPLNTNYLIYPNGDIINITTNRKLKPSKQIVKGKETGYIYVSLLRGTNKNWKLERTALHRVLAITFIDNTEGKPWVNHKDRNRSNNDLNNLEWSTISENIQHSFDNGRQAKKGIEHYSYGKTISQNIKDKMSEAKKGDKHPSFKGYYVINGVKYGSSYEAARQTNIKRDTIINKCKRGTDINYSFEPV
jgi:hypothetical protein